MRPVIGVAALLLVTIMGTTAPAAAGRTPAATISPATTQRGAQSEIKLIARIGFDPNVALVKRGCWARIQVDLTNEQNSVSGYLRITKQDRSREILVFEQPVDLPKNSNKRWTGYILADDDPNQLLVEYYSKRGRQLAYEPVTYGARDPDDDLILCYASELQQQGLRRFLSIVTQEAIDAQGAPQKGRYALFATKDLLPQEVQGYESVSAVVWDGDTLTELEKTRAVALKGWVFQGGTLIVAAGENAAAVRQSFLHDILPVEVISAEPADLRNAFLATFGSSPRTSEPMLIAAAKLRNGRVLMGSEEQPLVVEGAYGGGRVIFLAFSMSSWALQRWEDRDRLLDLMFQSIDPRLLNNVSAEARRAVDIRLKTNLLGQLPSPLFIAAFLGIYILLVVPVNYVIFRAIKRVEWAWLALPVIAIAFGLLAYNIGYLSQSRTLDCDEITFVEGAANTPVVSAKTFLGLYSPVRLNQLIRFTDRQAFARPLIEAGSGGVGASAAELVRNPLTATYTDKGFEVSDFIIHPMAARTLECDYDVDLGGEITSDLRLDQNKIRGTITNKLGYMLNDAIVVYPNGQMNQLGTLRSGEPYVFQDSTYATNVVAPGWLNNILNTQRRNVSQMDEGGSPYMYTRMGRQSMEGMLLFEGVGGAFRNTYAGGIGQAWFSGNLSRLLPRNSCLLVGWASRSAIDAQIGEGSGRRELKRRNQTLVHLFTLRLLPMDQESREISEAFWSIQVQNPSALLGVNDYQNPLADYNGQRPSRAGAAYLLKADENLIALRPMINIGMRRLDQLSIAYGIDLKTFGQSIRVMQPRGYEVALYNLEIKDWEPFESGKEIEIQKRADRYYDRIRGEIRLRIKVTDSEVAGTRQPGAPYGNQMISPFLHDVRIQATLTGGANAEARP
jgi:hypothetical protein